MNRFQNNPINILDHKEKRRMMVLEEARTIALRRLQCVVRGYLCRLLFQRKSHPVQIEAAAKQTAYLLQRLHEEEQNQKKTTNTCFITSPGIIDSDVTEEALKEENLHEKQNLDLVTQSDDTSIAIQSLRAEPSISLMPIEEVSESITTVETLHVETINPVVHADPPFLIRSLSKEQVEEKVKVLQTKFLKYSKAKGSPHTCKKSSGKDKNPDLTKASVTLQKQFRKHDSKRKQSAKAIQSRFRNHINRKKENKKMEEDYEDDFEE